MTERRTELPSCPGVQVKDGCPPLRVCLTLLFCRSLCCFQISSFCPITLCQLVRRFVTSDLSPVLAITLAFTAGPTPARNLSLRHLATSPQLLPPGCVDRVLHTSCLTFSDDPGGQVETLFWRSGSNTINTHTHRKDHVPPLSA